LYCKCPTNLYFSADDNLASWAYWDYSDGAFFNSSGLIQETAKLISRTYAYAIAGQPNIMVFTPETGDFTLAYNPTLSVQLLTS
jgi:hypothetical protein